MFGASGTALRSDTEYSRPSPDARSASASYSSQPTSSSLVCNCSMAKPWRPVTPSSLGTSDGVLSMKPSKTPRRRCPTRRAYSSCSAPPAPFSIRGAALKGVAAVHYEDGFDGWRASGLPSNSA